MRTNFELTRVQQTAFEALLDGIEAGAILVLEGNSGQGKTTILRRLHGQTGGALVGMREFVATLVEREFAAVEGAFVQLIERSLTDNNIVMVDDLHLVVRAVTRNLSDHTYILDAALTALLGEAALLKKTLVFTVAEGETPWPVQLRACSWKIGQGMLVKAAS